MKFVRRSSAVVTSPVKTGLMGSGWSDAQWISGGQPHFSKYRSGYNIGFDLLLPAESSEADFLFGYVDENNYVRMQLRREKAAPVFALWHMTDGTMTCDYEKPLKGMFRPATGDIAAAVRLQVQAHDYAKGYMILPSVNGNAGLKRCSSGREWRGSSSAH